MLCSAPASSAVMTLDYRIEFDVYYGMADNRIGVARLDVPEILAPEGVADSPVATF
jgi:predicted GH43/DUF377 family glycosyl hydrolase